MKFGRALRESHPLVLKFSTFNISSVSVAQKSVVLGVGFGNEVESAAIAFHYNLCHNRLLYFRLELELRRLEVDNTECVHAVFAYLCHKQELSLLDTLNLSTNDNVALSLCGEGTARPSEQCQ